MKTPLATWWWVQCHDRSRWRCLPQILCPSHTCSEWPDMNWEYDKFCWRSLTEGLRHLRSIPEGANATACTTSHAAQSTPNFTRIILPHSIPSFSFACCAFVSAASMPQPACFSQAESVAQQGLEAANVVRCCLRRGEEKKRKSFLVFLSF